MTFSPPMASAVSILQKLIAFPSISARANGEIANWIGRHLETLGFAVELTKYADSSGIEKANVVGCRRPLNDHSRSSGNGLAYFCHTDVVPPGHWTGPGGDPFVAIGTDDRIYGRGACDMKGSLAAALVAAAQTDPHDQTAPLWIVCTADEEVGFEGAKHLAKDSKAYREIVAADPLSIIGEPTEMEVVHAHKGIQGFEIVSQGRAAHSSSTDGINANIAMVPMLQKLLELGRQSETESRYQDGRFDPPTLSWNFGIREGGTAINITPERSVAWVTWRPMPAIDGRDLVEQAQEHAASLGLDFQFFDGGPPLWIDPDSECISALCEMVEAKPKTVCFGTDGGEFGELSRRVVWGPGSIDQAHTSDEFIALDQLASGVEHYTGAIRKWCC